MRSRALLRTHAPRVRSYTFPPPAAISRTWVYCLRGCGMCLAPTQAVQCTYDPLWHPHVPHAFRATVSSNRATRAPDHAFRMRSVQTFRKRRNMCLKFMRSICVPCNPSAKRSKIHSAGMRSNAFRATLPQICKRAMRSYEFRLRSVCVPPYFLKNLQKMDAFL